MGGTITVERFRELLPSLCDRETSQDPEHWTPENPLWGHCAVVSLVAQNLFGGCLLRAEFLIDGATHGSHYWNELPSGAEEDFTRAQLAKLDYTLGKPVKRERSYVLSFENPARRYRLLCWRLTKVLYPGNPLFEDIFFRKGFFKALESGCQKMWFGCVLVRETSSSIRVIAESANNPIAPLKSWCEPTCVRLATPSRQLSDIGACDHAEETAIWKAVHAGIDPMGCDIYIVGLYTNGLPWFQERRESTCLRCAREMWRAGIRRIWIPIKDRWEWLTPEEALHTARAYATGEKTV